jgi:hypothetical protein
MRQLAKSERRLLIVFGAALFVALNLFTIRFWLQNRGVLLAKITQTRTAISTGKSWISAAEAFQPARDWIEKNPSPANTGEQASTSLLNAVRSFSETSNLKLLEETLLPAESTPGGQAAILQVKLSGPFSGVASLLFELQTPSSWRAVDKIMIRSDNEPPNVIVDLVVRQYYSPPGQNPSAP